MKCLLIKSCILCILVMFLIVVFTGCGNSENVKLTITEERVTRHVQQEPVMTMQEVRVGDTMVLEAFESFWTYTITIQEIRDNSIKINVERRIGYSDYYELYYFVRHFPFGVESTIRTNTIGSWVVWRLLVTKE